MPHKIPHLTSNLKPHQARVVDRIASQPGLVVAHGLGSGKTLTSIAAAAKLGLPTVALLPAALQANYLKELAKHTPAGLPNLETASLQKAVVSKSLPPAELMIVDEAHRLRNAASGGYKLIREAPGSKRLLLTGTPLYNSPTDLKNLINLAANSEVFPKKDSDFEARYITNEEVHPSLWARLTTPGLRPGVKTKLKREAELKKLLNTWVDYHENTTEDFPERNEEVIRVPFGKKQKELYDFLESKAPPWLAYKLRAGLPPSKTEATQLNAFLTGLRQVSVSAGGFSKELSPLQAAQASPKLQEAYRRFEEGLKSNPKHKALIYSNFLEAGIAPYQALLEANKIPHGVFTGRIPAKVRNRMVQDFNEGNLKALLVSSAGGEGLDLKGVRQIQLLDPHWNSEKLEQVIGRGIRYRSHEGLPEPQRRVAVEHYRTTHDDTPPPSAWGFGAYTAPKSVDEYLDIIAHDKRVMRDTILKVLRENTATTKNPAGVKTAAFTRGFSEMLFRAVFP